MIDVGLGKHCDVDDEFRVYKLPISRASCPQTLDCIII